MNQQICFDPKTHTYRDSSGIVKPSVTWILAQSGLADFSAVEDEVRERAMQRGKSVHWMLQLQDEGRLNYRAVPKALRPYRKAYLDWKRGSGFQCEWIEYPFVSKFGYAGTLDRCGCFPGTEMFRHGSRAVIDFKTGSTQEWVKFQLAAYSLAVNPNPFVARTIRRIALALLPDGTYRVKEFPASEWENDFAVFIEAKKRVEDKL